MSLKNPINIIDKTNKDKEENVGIKDNIKKIPKFLFKLKNKNDAQIKEIKSNKLEPDHENQKNEESFNIRKINEDAKEKNSSNKINEQKLKLKDYENKLSLIPRSKISEENVKDITKIIGIKSKLNLTPSPENIKISPDLRNNSKKNMIENIFSEDIHEINLDSIKRSPKKKTEILNMYKNSINKFNKLDKESIFSKSPPRKNSYNKLNDGINKNHCIKDFEKEENENEIIHSKKSHKYEYTDNLNNLANHENKLLLEKDEETKLNFPMAHDNTTNYKNKTSNFKKIYNIHLDNYDNLMIKKTFTENNTNPKDKKKFYL